MSDDIAILHDQFRVMGGAERVACEMARALDCPILAARVDDGVPPDDVDVRQIFDGLGAWAMRQHYLVQDVCQMFNWQHRPECYQFDTIICNKTNPLWYVPRDDQTVLGYLHSTPRGLYDQFYIQGEARKQTVINTVMKSLFEPNRTQPDAWACNSDLVARRADLYWDRQRDVEVIYPPVKTQDFGADEAATQDEYLVFGRLHEHKRIDSVLETFQELSQRLVVGGDGPEREALEAMANGYDNIEIIGYMSEAEKRRRLSQAQAVITPYRREDFGIVPIEAFASGTPVIGVDEGFTQHQLLDGRNGLLYSHDDEGQPLAEAVERFSREGVLWDAREIERFADRFGVSRFHAQIQDWVADVEQRTAIEAPWEREEPLVVEESGQGIAITDGGEQ